MESFLGDPDYQRIIPFALKQKTGDLRMLYNRTICESLDRQRYQKNNRITRQEDLHVNYDYDPACILPNHVWFKPRIGI